MKTKITEQQVVDSIMKHQRAKLVAKDLGVSPNTISSLIKKFGVRDLLEKGFYSEADRVEGQEFKKKQSEEHIAKRRERMTGDRNPFFGKKHSEETKKKMSLNHADFTGDNNPLKRAMEKDPSIRVKFSTKKQDFWASKTKDEIFETHRDRTCIYKDISKGLWSRMKSNAKIRGMSVEISPEYLWDIWEKQEGRCALSGVKLNLRADEEITASIDRINSEIGYLEGNIQIVHKTINMMKWTNSNNDFINICLAVAAYHLNKA
jgi:hypothetical protein